MSSALFLDRDGVINVNHGYVFQREKFEFIPGIFELIALANQKKWPVIVVTNQSGIARKMYTQDDFLALTKWMLARCRERGAEITDVFWCPHHPTYSQRPEEKNCDCRKPQVGMFLQAQKRFEVDMATSIMIGDKQSDMLAAKNANIGKRILFTQDRSQLSEHQTRWHNASDLCHLDLTDDFTVL